VFSHLKEITSIDKALSLKEILYQTTEIQ